MGIKTRRFVTMKRTCSCTMPGIYRAVAHMEGVVVIFHSPKACSHVAQTMNINSFYRGLAQKDANLHEPCVPLISSLLTEKHSIFGGIEQLAKCIDYVVVQYHPHCLIIANSCVSGVIGDDVQALTIAKEQELGLPILTTPYCGFLDGEYYDGYDSIASLLIDRFVSKNSTKVPNSVVLIGDQSGPQGRYAREVTRLLGYFGLKVIAQFPTHMKFADLPRLAEASLAVLLGGSGPSNKGVTKIAKKLQEKLDIPYFGDNIFPLGWSGIERWLSALGKFLGQETVAKQAIEQERDRLQQSLTKYQDLKGVKTVVCLGRRLEYFNPEGILELLQMAQMQVLGIVILDCYLSKDKAALVEALQQMTTIPLVVQAEADTILSQADIVATTHELEGRGLRQMFIPMLPVVGIDGINSLLATLQMLYYRHGHKGGIVYA